MRKNVVDEAVSPDLQKMDTVVQEQLLLKSADFLGDSKWAFLYNGKAIYASIIDEDFNELVKKGKVKLSAGVRIPVELRIEVFLNEQLEVIKRVYTILKVTGEIIEPHESDANQMTLF